MGSLIGRVLRADATSARIALLCVGLASAVAPGQSAPERNYHARTWTTDDGLPHNSVGRVVQDTAGFLWFATGAGLARFDGREFREMRLPAEHRAGGFNIRGLAEERPGTLVVASASRALLRLTGSTWSVHPATAVLTTLGETALDVHVDPSGRLWIITGGRLLRWQQDGTHKIFGAQESMSTRLRRVSFAAENGGTWIGAEVIHFVDRDGELAPRESLPVQQGYVAPARGGRVWIWSNNRLVLLERGRTVKELDVPMKSNFGALRHVFEDSRGAIWISTSRHGLLCYVDDRLSRVSDYPSVSHVTEDREGNIWVATDGRGVGQLREKPYRLINATAGLREELVSSLTEDSTGRVWLANRAGGLAAVAPDGTVEQSGLTGTRAFANVVCADQRNRLWFGAGRNGLFRWAGGKTAPVRVPLPLADLHLLFRAKNGDVWFAADPGELGFYRDDQLHAVTAANGIVPHEIRAIAEDRAGDLWLGGRVGELLRWDGRNFERFDAARGFPQTPVHAICADAAGQLWIGTASGLVLKDGEQFRVLTSANGLADDIIQEILDDGQGVLWFAARRGLFYVAKTELLAAARDPSRRVESHRLGPEQGLVGLTPTPNYHPTACRARDGSLWFATAQGAVVVDPSRLPRGLPVPPVLIDEVRLDGETLPHDQGLRIPSGRQRIEFRFAALSYTAPESVLVRHQLVGADPRWVDTGIERIASYTNLPPGDYRLRVHARNSAGRWNTEGATLAFTVVPAWWETFGFRFSAAVVLVVVVAWIARTIAQRRLHQRLRRLEAQHALEKERARIARDLHDDLGAGLTEVGLLADRLVGTAPNDLAPQLSGLAWRTRRLATELSGIVWTMNASNASLDHLAQFLRRYAERLFRHTGTRCIVTGIESIPPVPIPPDWQHQILAATKEALNNVLKHARGTEARVELRHAEGVFEIRIRDNGVGCALDPEAASDRNGLRNMRARLHELGGTFEIKSAPAAGTEVILRAPCARVEQLS